MATVNSLPNVLPQFDAAAERFGLHDGLRRRLLAGDRFLILSVPTMLDDGGLKVFTGYRVQHINTLGPFSGPAHGRAHDRRKTRDGRASPAGNPSVDPRTLSQSARGSSSRKHQWTS